MSAGRFFVGAGCAVILAVFGAFPVFADEITAGAAKEVFSLPAHVPLAGYSKRHGKAASGMHDPVGVRALVLRGNDAAVALVSCDLLVVDENLFRAVQAALKSNASQPPLTLMVAATHTHSGPGAYGRRFAEKISMGHYDQRVFDALVTAITKAVESADRLREPILFDCGLGNVEGVIKNRVEEGGFADTGLAVCGVYSQKTNQPLAVLINFSAHPTALGAWNRQLSADYPGVVMQEMGKQFPDTTVFFFAGAVGDQAPIKSGDGFGRALFVAEPLVRQAAELLPQLKPKSVLTLQAAQKVIKLPPAKVRLSKRWGLPRWFSRRLADDDASLAVTVIGKTAWFGVPCDLSSTLGRQLKEAAQSRGLFPVIMGFTNDYIGYCMTESVYQTGEYEALMGFNGPKAGQLVVDELIRMLDQQGAGAQNHVE